MRNASDRVTAKKYDAFSMIDFQAVLGSCGDLVMKVT